MKRTLYAYELTIIKRAGKRYKMPDNVLGDIRAAMADLNKKSTKTKKEVDNKDKKIVYIDDIRYVKDGKFVDQKDVGKKENVVNEEITLLKFISAKFDSRRKVVNTETMEERGILKGKNDGDKEKNHMALKYLDDGKIVCIFEVNVDGIGCKKILHYIERRVVKYHEKREDNIRYRIEGKNIVSKDFIMSLEKMHKIKAVTLTVDQEDVSVSEVKELSGRNDISNDVDIVLKRSSSKTGIFSSTVKDFYKLYNDKSKRIKRVTVEGDNINNDPISFNTEQMKEKVVVEVDTEIGTGEVNTKDMYRKLIQEVECY